MELRYCALVLRKKEVGETDRLYTLYTREQGKVQAKAAGVRRQEARLASQLETLTYGFIMVVRGKGMGKIAGAVAENSFPHLRTDLEILERTLQIIQIVERLVSWEEKDQELFDLLLSYLELGNELVRSEKKEKFFLLSEAFLIQLFAHLGYRIETGTCSVSGEKLKPGERHFFSPSAGGMVSHGHSVDVHQAFPIRENTIKLIRLFLNNRLENIPRVHVGDKELRDVRRVAASFYQWIAH